MRLDLERRAEAYRAIEIVICVEGGVVLAIFALAIFVFTAGHPLQLLDGLLQ